MKESKDIEKLFREGLQHAESPVSASVWEGVQTGLSNAAASGATSLATKGIMKSLSAKIIAAASLAAVGAASVYMLSNKNTVSRPEKTQNSSSTTTTPLAKQDDTAPALYRAKAQEKSLGKTRVSKSNSDAILPENTLQEELTLPVSSSPKKTDDNTTRIDSKDKAAQESTPSQNTQETSDILVTHEEAVMQPIENKVDEPTDFNNTAPVSQEPRALDITLPNIITPNGDGKNDGLRFDLPATKRFDLQVYNSQGELVFHSIDPHVVWTGVSLNGELVQEGRYVYKVSAETEDGQILEQKTQSLLVNR